MVKIFFTFERTFYNYVPSMQPLNNSFPLENIFIFLQSVPSEFFLRVVLSILCQIFYEIKYRKSKVSLILLLLIVKLYIWPYQSAV